MIAPEMKQAQPAGRWLAMALSALMLLMGPTVLSGCGGDEEEGGAGLKRPGGGGGGGGGGAKRGGRKRSRGKKLSTYDKVPDDFRPSFSDQSFVPDITGDLNRDPYRSYVVNDARGQTASNDTINPTDVCTTENSVATNYSLRDLNLIGIVLRGTRSYALFRDSGGYGHIVRRGDCLGKEQARVENIGAGFVRLAVTPEAPPGAPAPAAQTRDILLYPEELSVDVIEGDGG